jgi:hypothetical protein
MFTRSENKRQWRLSAQDNLPPFDRSSNVNQRRECLREGLIEEVGPIGSERLCGRSAVHIRCGVCATSHY